MQGRKGKGENERGKGRRGWGGKKEVVGREDEEGRKLCNFLRKLGWSILNGDVEGDEEGKWTYTGGKGRSVINYVLGNEKTRKGVRWIKVGGNEERIDSNHLLLTVWVEGRRDGGRGKQSRRKRE